MIHSARPIVTPVANIVFCCFVFLDLKSGDGRTTCAKTMVPTGRDFGLAEWIKKHLSFYFNVLPLLTFLWRELNYKLSCNSVDNAAANENNANDKGTHTSHFYAEGLMLTREP